MTEAPRTESAAVARFLCERTGLHFPVNRSEALDSAVRRGMARAGVSTPDELVDVLRADDAALDALVSEVTVGETYLFRDPEQLAFVREEVLPELVRRRGPAHGMRVLSAGCASGEEAYSLAILLDEAGLLANAHVLGVDISRPALASARRGAYGRWSLRGLEDAAVQRYLHPMGDRWVVDDRIRRRVSFEYLNLAGDAYPSLATGIFGLDLILCRNVLIYLDARAVRRVANRLFQSLADGGWLVAGPSDPPLSDLAPFEAVVSPAGVFYRRQPRAERAPEPRSDAPAAARRPSADARPPAAQTRAIAPPPSAPDGAPAPAAESAEPARAPLDGARQALACGDYASAIGLLRADRSPAAAAVLVRAHANSGNTDAALAVAEEAVRRYPLEPELHFLFAMLLVEAGRHDAAIAELRRALYLDRSLAAAHLALGSLLRRRGDLAGARRAYRNAAGLAGARPPGEPVPLGDGETAGSLADAARAQAALLGDDRAHGDGRSG